MRKSLNYMLVSLMCFLAFIVGTIHLNSHQGSRIERVLRRVDVQRMWTNVSMWFREPAPRSIVVEVPDIRTDPTAVVLCVASSDEGRTERLVRVLNAAFMPSNVDVHLVVAGGANSTLRAWRHGHAMATRNASSAWVGNRSSCFVVMDDTVDPGPYFVMWFWRMCATRRVDLIAGDEVGSGLAPVYGLWKRFMRRDNQPSQGNLTARMLAYYNASSVCQPPAADDNVLVRAEYQPMAERERLPRLARVWREAFVSEAVDC